MCGIVLTIRPLLDPSSSTVTACGPTRTLDQSTSPPAASRDWDDLTLAVKDRGPDSAHTLTLETRHLELKFHATVLHLRGERVTRQPFHDEESGDVLLWNGEIFDAPSLPVELNENDGEKLFRLIRSVGFFEAMRRLQGPHALIYYERSTQKIYYTRDCLGRRSLLVSKPMKDDKDPTFVLTSTAPPRLRDSLEEVSCEGIWELDLNELEQRIGITQGHDWFEPGKGVVKLHKRFYVSEAPASEALVYPFRRLNRSLPTMGSLHPMTRSFPPLPVLSSSYLELISTFKSLLLESIRQRVLTIPFASPDTSSAPAPAHDPDQPATTYSNDTKPRIAILFSGGLDCTSLALLVDEILPPEEGIDLINVSFENPRKLQLANDQGGKKKQKKETKKERQDRIKREEREGQRSESVESPHGRAETPGKNLGQDAEKETSVPNTPIEGASADDSAPSTASGSIYDVPDRLTGLDSWRELCSLRSNRRWNFVQVDVPYREMLEHRQKVIDLMYPQDTVMDLSIAIAFYFAARGKGVLASPPEASASPTDPRPYESTSRVLLSGLGADELLGGYSRHRKAYNQYQPSSPSSTTVPPPPLPDSPQGHVRWTSLIEELQMDLDRLSKRNLGRDDRIVSSQSKEVRYPFLSNEVVDFLVGLSVWDKCDMRFEEGLGDKLLLRMLVRDLMRDQHEPWNSGKVWRLKKRAIHFGARTAKMELETGKAKGTDRL